MEISRQQMLIAKLIKLHRLMENSKQNQKLDLVVIQETTNVIDDLSDPKLNDFLIHLRINRFIRTLSNLIGFNDFYINGEARQTFEEIKQLAFEYKNSLGSAGPLM
ncbi:hypothetical protein FEZ51_05550 [Pediococcus stilesii]|uniref:Bacteriocin immunity protein n=1 Tax=Pediococcus stilesii TaxID=331679 RepID=A0A5R9BUF1_9LACO|nr:hypothetical protein [Pediococcus stilesii]TLQ04267.1 hypothetical protein FEZ51_05550 [Pediococcus stilesii]